MTERAGASATLIIGYGNDLRRDDAAGRRAAEQVAARDLPGVRVLSVPQLAPEHVVDAAACGLVIFVDASTVDDVVTVRTVTPTWPTWRLTHHLTPASLLGLARTLGGASPTGVVVTIPVTDAALGLSLSPAAAHGVRDAVEQVVRLCTGADRQAAAPHRPVRPATGQPGA